ncbi:hypothetical protein AC1031_004639 [Aphanomyces cochlioides]|nr:hypothetical protein AC1031_004639 [Aphanomyces cochlioides]
MELPQIMSFERSVAESTVTKVVQFACHRAAAVLASQPLDNTLSNPPADGSIQDASYTSDIIAYAPDVEPLITSTPSVNEPTPESEHVLPDKPASPDPPTETSPSEKPVSPELFSEPAPPENLASHEPPPMDSAIDVESLTIPPPAARDEAVCMTKSQSSPQMQPLESSALSLYEETKGSSSDLHALNVITHLAMYPVTQHTPDTLTKARKKKVRHADAEAPLALFDRTKQAVHVYLPDSPDLIGLKSPPRRRPLEPIVFKGGTHKPFTVESPKTMTNSPRLRKLQQSTQYGSLTPSKRPNIPATKSDISSAAHGSQVSGFCRQCLLVGDMCKLAECREHNYFPKLKSSKQGPK